MVTRPARPLRRLSVLLAVGAILLTGCSTATPAATTNATGTAASTGEAVPSPVTIIDVRTPAEYAAGHLAEAVNIDLSAADFAEHIEALDPSAGYTVYCRTGNRSATAVGLMTEQGFTDVTDGGSMEEASVLTGLAVVTT